MFCPECRLEYLDHVTICPDCNRALVACPQSEQSPGFEFHDLVTVYATGNAAQLLVAKSLMEAAEIAFYVKGDQLADITGRLGFNPAVGDYEVQVREEDAAVAREILATLNDS